MGKLTIVFIGPLILVFIGISIGLGFLFYFVFKKLGYPKTAKYLTITYGLFVVKIELHMAFEDQLFTKNNAKELIEEQDIKLTDDFELLKNESRSAIGDYYHTFTLKISERNKQNTTTNMEGLNVLNELEQRFNLVLIDAFLWVLFHNKLFLITTFCFVFFTFIWKFAHRIFILLVNI